MGVQPGQKKHKKNKKNKSQANEKSDTKLTLTIETLGYFDQIKVSPPTFAKEIDEVNSKLEEKKNYFIKISDELNEGKKIDEIEPKAEKTETVEEEKKEETERPAKNPKTNKVNLDDDEMFPAMGLESN